MFKAQKQFTNSFFGAYAYDPIITRHENHILVRMNKLIDWSFVENEVADCYSDQGQHAYHPVILFKLHIIQHLYNLAERGVCEQTDLNVMYRYFVGLGMTEEVPHWTDMGKFRQRIGEEAFERLFYRVLDEAERLGIKISKKRNVDATDVKADVDIARCVKGKQGDDDKSWIDRNSTDSDARCGRKGNKPNSKRWYGYKSHMNQDTETELIMAATTTDASQTDESQMVRLIEKEQEFRGKYAIRKQGGDKAYVGHYEELEKRGVLDYTIPRDNMQEEQKKKQKNRHYLHVKYQRYKVERKFAEGKKHHHLGKARYRGRWRVHIQSLLIYLTMNLKRIVNLVMPIPAKIQVYR
jgi:IS5 family transposase